MGLALLLGAGDAAAQTAFTAQLFGQDAVPPVDTEATGSCVGILTGVLGVDELGLALSCGHDAAGATAVHLHRGFPGQTGPVVATLATPVAVQSLTAVEAVFLQAGGLYVDVHTAADPEGEVRGQLDPVHSQAVRRTGFPLEGEQVVPPVATDRAGACVAELMDRSASLIGEYTDLDLCCAYDLESPELPVVHVGPPGEDGTPRYGFPGPQGGLSQPGNVECVFGLPLDQLDDDLLAGRVYVEVASEAHPEGVLRGQIPACFVGPNTLCLVDGRFRVEIDWATALEAGEGRADGETDDSGTFWFFRPSNLEILVKALDGCDVNGHHWVFFAATTNVGFELTVTDTATGQTKTYDNALGHTADPVLDAAAFATCP